MQAISYYVIARILKKVIRKQLRCDYILWRHYLVKIKIQGVQDQNSKAYIWHCCIRRGRIHSFLFSPADLPTQTTKCEANYEHYESNDNCHWSNDFGLSTPFLPGQKSTNIFIKVLRSEKFEIMQIFFVKSN